jgi:hypothetical protein
MTNSNQPVEFVPQPDGSDAVVINTRAMDPSWAVCYECHKEIPSTEWRKYAKMCKACWDKDGSWD